MSVEAAEVTHGIRRVVDLLPGHSGRVHLDNNLLLISMTTDPSASRAQARLGIRAHLRDALGEWLDLKPHAITFISEPGKPPRVIIDGEPEPGLSISHETGLSLAAVNLQGPVGVDLMKPQDIADWLIVSKDYLGPTITCQLLATPDTQRTLAFTKAWCQREALLKLHGQPLMESAALPVLAGCVGQIDLPLPWVAMVALPVITLEAGPD